MHHAAVAAVETPATTTAEIFKKIEIFLNENLHEDHHETVRSLIEALGRDAAKIGARHERPRYWPVRHRLANGIGSTPIQSTSASAAVTRRRGDDGAAPGCLGQDGAPEGAAFIDAIGPDNPRATLFMFMQGDDFRTEIRKIAEVVATDGDPDTWNILAAISLRPFAAWTTTPPPKRGNCSVKGEAMMGSRNPARAGKVR